LLRATLPLLAGPAVMTPWFLQAVGAESGHGSSGALAHLWASRPRLVDDAAMLRHWFMDGYSGAFDDILALVMIATLAILTGDLPRAPRDPQRAARGADGSAGAHHAPLILSAVLAALYLLLPFEIHAPFQWWAMNVRTRPLLFVWLVVAVPPGALAGRRRLLLVPVTLVSAAFLVYVTVDIRGTFNGAWGMAGFADVIAQAPQGARVLGLYTDYRQPPHYAHYPFYYASSYAVVEHGGMAAPRSPIPQSWTDLRTIPAFPTAGDAALFRFPRHAQGFSHFLVRTCEGSGCVADPLAGSPDVRPVAESGRWRLYACASPGCVAVNGDGPPTALPKPSLSR
jgi:hypothetical protein